MSQAYTRLESKIRKAGDPEDSISMEKLEAAVYRAYTTSKITPDEYNRLCRLIDYISG